MNAPQRRIEFFFISSLPVHRICGVIERRRATADRRLKRSC
jgi:hypothetical protein